MSLAFASELDSVPPTRVGVPVVPHWTVPRPVLDRQLDRGAEGVLTVVTGPDRLREDPGCRLLGGRTDLTGRASSG